MLRANDHYYLVTTYIGLPSQKELGTGIASFPHLGIRVMGNGSEKGQILLTPIMNGPSYAMIMTVCLV